MLCAHRIGILAVLIAQGLAGEAQLDRLTPSGRTGFHVDYDVSDKPAPKWENGYVLAYDNESGNTPLVSVFGPSGSKLFGTQLVLDGFSGLRLRTIAASSKGTVAVAGGAYDAAGVITSLIAYLDSAGRPTHVIKLDGFVPILLCFTADGRLWVAGRVKPGPGLEDPPDHDMVRIYDENGKLQSSLLRRSLFSKGGRLVSGLSQLAASSRKVVFFNYETGDVAEMSHGGEVLATRRVPLPPQTFATGLAVSDGSEIAISRQRPDPANRRTELVDLCLLDANANRWLTIYTGDVNNRDGYGMVFGFKGESMLVGAYHPGIRFSWVRIKE